MNPLLGRTLAGRYRVEAPIGRGGMAEVYKVWDEQRAVYLAMKLLREDIAQDRIFLRRFKREAQTLSTLQHPNIVRFYGLEQDGLLAFMLMDYVEGTTLRAEIFQADSKPIPLEQTINTIRPICSALHYAHGQGRVHCDVKPGNIMLRHNGDVLLADFGIARMTDAATATMIGAGTPAYMAPEQVRGQDPTPHTDIYALGVVLFEMLTGGERPFTGERATISGTTGERVRWEQMHLDPPDPSQFNPALRAETAELLGACLSKEPASRPGSVLEVLNRLTGAAPAPEAVAADIEDDLTTIIEPEPVEPPIAPALSLQEQAGLIPASEKLGNAFARSSAKMELQDQSALSPSIRGVLQDFSFQDIATFVFGKPEPLPYPGTKRWILLCLLGFVLGEILFQYNIFYGILGTPFPLVICAAIALRMKPVQGSFWVGFTMLPLFFLAPYNPWGWLLAGTAMGFTQSFFFHKPLRRTWLWIVASALGYYMPALIYRMLFYLGVIPRYSGISFWLYIIVSSCIQGSIYSVITLPILKRLTKRLDVTNA